MPENLNLTFNLRRNVSDSPSYYSAALTALRKFTRCDSLPQRRLTPDLIDRFAAWLAANGKTPATVSTYLRALRAIHGADLREGLIGPTDAFAAIAATPATPGRQPRTRWRALINNTHPTRTDLIAADPLLAAMPLFIPRATIMKRTPAGLKPAPDPTLRRLLFFRATAPQTTALQQRLGRSATILFNRDGKNRTYAAIPDRQMHMFRLAITGGIESIDDLPADTRAFTAGRRVRVVGHPLFDGLEGTVADDAAASALRVRVAITGLNKLLLTPSLPKQFLLPL